MFKLEQMSKDSSIKGVLEAELNRLGFGRCPVFEVKERESFGVVNIINSHHDQMSYARFIYGRVEVSWDRDTTSVYPLFFNYYDSGCPILEGGNPGIMIGKNKRDFLTTSIYDCANIEGKFLMGVGVKNNEYVWFVDGRCSGPESYLTDRAGLYPPLMYTQDTGLDMAFVNIYDGNALSELDSIALEKCIEFVGDRDMLLFSNSYIKCASKYRTKYMVSDPYSLRVIQRNCVRNNEPFRYLYGSRYENSFEVHNHLNYPIAFASGRQDRIVKMKKSDFVQRNPVCDESVVGDNHVFLFFGVKHGLVVKSMLIPAVVDNVVVDHVYKANLIEAPCNVAFVLGVNHVVRSIDFNFIAEADVFRVAGNTEARGIHVVYASKRYVFGGDRDVLTIVLNEEYGRGWKDANNFIHVFLMPGNNVLRKLVASKRIMYNHVGARSTVVVNGILVKKKEVVYQIHCDIDVPWYVQYAFLSAYVETLFKIDGVVYRELSTNTSSVSSKPPCNGLLWTPNSAIPYQLTSVLSDEVVKQMSAMIYTTQDRSENRNKIKQLMKLYMQSGGVLHFYRNLQDRLNVNYDFRELVRHYFTRPYEEWIQLEDTDSFGIENYDELGDVVGDVVMESV